MIVRHSKHHPYMDPPLQAHMIICIQSVILLSLDLQYTSCLKSPIINVSESICGVCVITKLLYMYMYMYNTYAKENV